ncbi:S9 family peptidase [Synechococcus sp. CBW1107]|uniref:S9 family peptidase n=1 Tax=Synechococcus sp. CBW1107 TaxID=2789857 RepID=UPI0018CD3E90|nr:prolyl oligopeptidase family serine peptidase [Synechococcus sp. CBW1107]QPN55816.1 S9 family peptidase [Synechococcus sp. CBW1107]CAK6701189.1 hypothetical protein BBFGKLBO_03041 [Synechococcus sp. CBW1107]
MVGRTPRIKEPQLHRGRLFWLEQRPAEQGRTTLMMRPSPTAEAIELTPGDWNLRSRVHEYGGGVVAVDRGPAGASAGGPVVVVNDRDRCLWRLETERPSAQPMRLTEPGERAFADGLIDGRRRRWIGVMEAGGLDQLVAVPLEGGEPQLLRQALDFCGYAVLSPDGGRLAWVEWQQPHMPWERSQLWLADVLPGGELGPARLIAGSGTAGQPAACSVFQPLWLANGDLVVANDRHGWWNLERLEATGAGAWQRLLPMEAEFGMPQWVYGMLTTAWDGRQLVAAACVQGRWQLGRVLLNTRDPDGGTEPALARWEPIPCPFDDLEGLWAENGQLVAVAADASTEAGLLSLDLARGRWRHQAAADLAGVPAAVRRPLAHSIPADGGQPAEALWFEGYGGRPTHAWYHPPQGGGNAGAPLLVKGHSGPTGMAGTGLNPAIQYWTSRGWGVVDVNYGGSTGFGRAYRERLDGLWGVVDVADCSAAARALVATGRASPERIAIEGGSAGGFTVLAALCFSDVFRAGACRYAVADLASLADSSHRFEARYLDGLVGPWPAARAIYEARSPLHHAERIRCPVIFFQGLEDKVVPPAQTERIVEALVQNRIPVELHRFPGEGHGFRSGTVQIEVLEATEAFFRKHLAL